jgi:sugar lactone lactonase YvrE/4-amino-4-deoxy-L-arabinose transferase-like glycosyltransferase
MSIAQSSPVESKPSWLDRHLFHSPVISLEKLLFAVILIVAIFTRLYMLEPRVMSHDETSHTYFSWLYYKGDGYAHDPVTHGPLQFHLVALSYFLFGDSDTTARIPAALFSIAAVAFMWAYRRYLGRAGALIAALLLTISPYMLYYGRYVRNEAFVAFFALVTLWSILRYLDTAKYKYLYILTVVTVLQFCTKETAFIYVAQALLFLGIYFVYRLSRRRWNRPEYRSSFILALVFSLVLVASGMLIRLLANKVAVTGLPAYPTFASLPPFVSLAVIALGLVGLAITIYFALAGLGLERIRQERSFDLLMLLGTLVLPQLSAFGINAFGWTIPVNAAEVHALTNIDIVHMAIIVVPVFIISIILGLWWNKREWLINAGIWYAIYIVLYTSMFTNGAGFFTGLVGSLGYWLAQQSVNRGDQPLYYYFLIQIPIYEFLPAIGSLIGIVLALMGRKKVADDIFPQENQMVEDSEISPDIDSAGESLPELSPEDIELPATEESIPDQPPVEQPKPVYVEAPTVGLLIFWVITSLLAYTVAGEKMPWLTVHITLPMILLTGWAVGYLVDTTDWATLRNKKGWLAVALLLVFIPALVSTFRIWLGVNPPFEGKSLEQLAATSGFIIALLAAIASGIGLVLVTKDWSPRLVIRTFGLVFLGFLAVLTARAAWMASYINYDLAKEYLVYAHCAPGDKIALEQITDISKRLTGGLDIVVAYDDKTTYPFWWYLRNFPNQRYFGNAPTRDLRDAPLILVGQDNFGKIEPVVGQAYDMFEYNRIWWPNMDYFNLDKERILYALTDPQMREAIFQIWLNRDYTLYGQLTNKNMSLQNWSPAEKFRLYIRKDIVAQLWDYGSTAVTAPIQADPYEGKQISINADQSFGTAGSEPGQFQTPRDLALAPDGSLYVADTFNNRIQHLAADGSVLQVWGSFADISKGTAPGGTFFEPWGIAVGADGSVYVADTWNHRIQKFTSDGKFVNMWGYFGQADTPFAIWGPRDIAIDANNHIYITDTGNKRVVIYDENGNYINQFGSLGLEPGQFDEPVGVAVDKDGVVYITDTWNQRIQAMTPDSSGNYIPLTNWEIVAWYGQSLDNKPFLAVDDSGNLYTTDPEGYRVLHFTTTGTFINYFGDYGSGPNQFNLPTGIITDGKGGVWIADAGNNRILHFTLPAK